VCVCVPCYRLHDNVRETNAVRKQWTFRGVDRSRKWRENALDWAVDVRPLRQNAVFYHSTTTRLLTTSRARFNVTFLSCPFVKRRTDVTPKSSLLKRVCFSFVVHHCSAPLRSGTRPKGAAGKTRISYITIRYIIRGRFESSSHY